VGVDVDRVDRCQVDAGGCLAAHVLGAAGRAIVAS
jgi:hypothetical protein